MRLRVLCCPHDCSGFCGGVGAAALALLLCCCGEVQTPPGFCLPGICGTSAPCSATAAAAACPRPLPLARPAAAGSAHSPPSIGGVPRGCWSASRHSLRRARRLQLGPSVGPRTAGATLARAPLPPKRPRPARAPGRPWPTGRAAPPQGLRVHVVPPIILRLARGHRLRGRGLHPPPSARPQNVQADPPVEWAFISGLAPPHCTLLGTPEPSLRRLSTPERACATLWNTKPRAHAFCLAPPRPLLAGAPLLL
jgi:hypothetical protein